MNFPLIQTVLRTAAAVGMVSSITACSTAPYSEPSPTSSDSKSKPTPEECKRDTVESGSYSYKPDGCP
jgi:hypothetical protein